MTILTPATEPTCPARLNGGTLTCTREPMHSPGHVYVSREASDRHDATEATDD